MDYMPENFSETLGNWKSRAKDTYHRTTLVKAQAQFCKFLGSQRYHTQGRRSILEDDAAIGRSTLEEDAAMVKITLQRMFGSRISLPNIWDKRT